MFSYKAGRVKLTSSFTILRSSLINRACMILTINYPRINLMNTGMRNVSCILLIRIAKYMMNNLKTVKFSQKKRPLKIKWPFFELSLCKLYLCRLVQCVAF